MILIIYSYTLKSLKLMRSIFNFIAINALSFIDTEGDKGKVLKKTPFNRGRACSSGCFLWSDKSHLSVFTGHHLFSLVPCLIDALRGIINVEIF